LGEGSPSKPKKLGAGKGVSPKLLGCGRRADSNPLSIGALLDPILSGPVSGPNSLERVFRTQG